jgi:uncharacterized protein
MSISGNEKMALKALQTELSKDFSLKDFRLFGSKARGDDSPGADLDVMIVLEDSSPAVEEKIDDLIFDLNLKYDCLITALYFSRCIREPLRKAYPFERTRKKTKPCSHPDPASRGLSG